MERGKQLLPPYRVISEFLPDVLVQELLAYAEAHQGVFEASGTQGGYDPAVRVSQILPFSAALKQQLTDHILPLTAQFIEMLGVSAFEPEGVELQLVAHGDGAFYARHIDTFTGEAADTSSGHQRMISAVFYLHHTPKAFAGGALRLYALGRADTLADFVDIEPQHNSLLIFPSWAPHSVERVSCPSGEFSDSRFAINAWVWRKKPE